MGKTTTAPDISFLLIESSLTTRLPPKIPYLATRSLPTMSAFPSALLSSLLSAINAASIAPISTPTFRRFISRISSPTVGSSSFYLADGFEAVLVHEPFMIQRQEAGAIAMALLVAKTCSGHEYKVKDISQADFGCLEIELAEVEMHGLMAYRFEYGPSPLALPPSTMRPPLLKELGIHTHSGLI